jgi:hypothetical protein
MAMPKLKREMFLRAIRFTHRFGDPDDQNVQGGSEYFEFNGPQPPISARNHSSQALDIQKNGLHVPTKPQSPVSKFKGGRASISGPRLDVADVMAETPPTSTKKRGLTQVN